MLDPADRVLTTVRIGRTARLRLKVCFALTFTLRFLTACGAGGAEFSVAPPTQQVSVAVSPGQAVLATSRGQQFTAAVRGTTNPGVQWSAGGVPGGSTAAGIITPSGLYTAPSLVPSSGYIVITATSLTDGSKSASASVQVVNPPSTVAVSIYPIQVTMGAGQSQQFAATVSGTSNGAVTWEVDGIVSGDASVGTISATGLYTAPVSVSGPATITVSVRSSFDPNSFADASLTLGLCGPPAYPCSRTDETVTQPDAGIVPNFGGLVGVGTVITDPLYNNVRIIRCTDTNTNSSEVSYYAGLGGNSGLNAWNVDDTQVVIGDLGGDTFIERFDASGHACSPVLESGGGIFFLDGGVFSRNDPFGGPYIYYDYGYNGHPFQVTPISVPAIGSPTPGTPVAKFGPALYLSGVPAWPGAGQDVRLGTVIKPTSSNPSKWLFQALNNGTTNVSAEPNWSTSTIPYQSGTYAASEITDGNVTWANIGAAYSSSSFVDLNGVEGASDRYVGESVSFDGGQDTGTLALVYDRIANVIYQYSTWTGIETDYICTGGAGYLCTGGSWVASVIGMATTTDRFVWHTNGLTIGGKYQYLVSGGICFHCESSGQIAWLWKYGTATLVELVPSGQGHSATGYSHFANNDANLDYYRIRDYADPSTTAPMWWPNPCTDNSENNPPYAYPPCYPFFDSHLGWNFNHGGDQEPLIGTANPGGVTNSFESPIPPYPALSPWIYELIGVSTCGTAAGQPTCPPGYPTNTVWRFGRTFNFSTEANFYSSISSGTVSQTGKYFALTSTGNGTMGSTAGGSTCNGGYSWSPKWSYSANKEITPINGNADYYTFKTSNACSSGNTEPNWSQDGSTPVNDNTCTWNPIGVTNCRSDVLIYKLQ